MPRRPRRRRRKTEARLIRMPADWWKRIEKMKAKDQSVSDFLRRIVFPRVNKDPARPLTSPDEIDWGGSRR